MATRTDRRRGRSCADVTQMTMVVGLMITTNVLVIGLLGLIYLGRQIPDALLILLGSVVTGWFAILRNPDDTRDRGQSGVGPIHTQQATFEAPAATVPEKETNDESSTGGGVGPEESNPDSLHRG